jgi:branched-chain amino acid transport system ATP-binding protein
MPKSPTSGPLLSVAGLNTFYGRHHILFDVGLEVNTGECVVLLGRNGAGKTTTLKSIMGVIPARDGEIRFAARSISGLPPDIICRHGVGYVPEENRIFRGLTVRENLDVARRPPRDDTYPPWTDQRIFGLFPMLADMVGRRGDSLSGGQQRMLAIARTLIGNPRLILLDEPSEGLAPLVINQLADQLTQLKSTGTTILLSEQNLRFALSLADRVYILEKGEIKYHGLPADLAQDQTVKEAYLAF